MRSVQKKNGSPAFGGRAKRTKSKIGLELFRIMRVRSHQ